MTSARHLCGYSEHAPGNVRLGTASALDNVALTHAGGCYVIEHGMQATAPVKASSAVG